MRGIYQIFTPRTLAVQDGEISVKPPCGNGSPSAEYSTRWGKPKRGR